MMESNEFPEVPSVGASESGSTNMASNPQSEDAEESDSSQNAQSSGSSEPPSLLDPSLQRGRNPGTKTAMTSDQSQKAAKQMNPSTAIVPKLPTTHLSLLIFTAVATCKKKSGLSMQALKKIVTSMGYNMDKKKHYFLRSIKNMVSKGQLWQVKGTGATGSYKINPNIGKKKNQPKMRGKGKKAKDATKTKGSPTTSRNGRNNGKKQGKGESNRATKKNRVLTIQASQNQVKV